MWLNGEVEPTYDRIPGYTHWVRKDRIGRIGGDVAACFKNDLQTQEVSPNLPHLMEALFFRIVLQDNSGFTPSSFSSLSISSAPFFSGLTQPYVQFQNQYNNEL